MAKSYEWLVSIAIEYAVTIYYTNGQLGLNVESFCQLD